jgi:hypothetical protein
MKEKASEKIRSHNYLTLTCLLGRDFRLRRIDGDLGSLTIESFVLDVAVDQSEQGIITGSLNIVAGMDLRSSLTIDNGTRMAPLSITKFSTKTLSVRITTVLSGGNTLMRGEELNIEN